MTITTKYLLSIVAFALVGAVFFANQALAVIPNFQSKIVDQTTAVVGPDTDRTIFTARAGCASRIISTVGVPIMIAFDDTNVSATTGILQASSTTVVYDAEHFGCGAITGYAAGSTTVNTAEFNF